MGILELNPSKMMKNRGLNIQKNVGMLPMNNGSWGSENRPSIAPNAPIFINEVNEVHIFIFTRR